MTLPGLKIDTANIGRGIYDMIVDAGQEHIVSFGMIPVQFIDLCEKQLREKIVAIAAAKVECTPEEFQPFVDQEKLNALVNPIMHEVSVAIYRTASERGAMVV